MFLTVFTQTLGKNFYYVKVQILYNYVIYRYFCFDTIEYNITMSNKVYLPPDQHMKFKMNVTDDEMYWNNSKSKYEIYV